MGMRKQLMIYGTDVLFLLVAGLSGCIDQRQSVEHEDLSNTLKCIHIYDDEFVINTLEEYQELMIYEQNWSVCNEFELPEINFAEKTLLGKYVDSGGCTVDFVRKVYKENTNKNIVYSIEVIKQGDCEKLEFSMNWITIPKIPSDYTVAFDVKRTNLS